jgi:ribosomal protein S18 acetylase RimI-like enzyme
MVDYTLRKATPRDHEWIYRIKKNAFKRYVVENWGSWDAASQREYFKTFVEKYDGNIFIIQIDGVDVGFFAGRVELNGDYHIGTIVIRTEYQGKGIGTQVIRDIIKRNRNRNIDVKYFKKNPVGDLYRQLGFVPHGETKYHYHVIKWALDS